MRPGLASSGTLGAVAALIALAPLPAAGAGGPATAVASAGHSVQAAPPCTRSALEAAMRRDHTNARLSTKHSFSCARRFAYAFATVGAGKAAYDVNLLFRAHGMRWEVVSRAKYCSKPEVPARIKRAVCFSD